MPNRYFYKLNDRIFFVNDDDEELHENSIRITYQAEGFYHYFECFKGYDANIEGLIQFRHDFLLWTAELRPLLDYHKYFSHGDSVTNTFKRYSTNEINKLKVENIHIDESFYMESTNNGGWMNLNESYKNKTIKSYGYDQTSFYPYLLANSDFKFPIKQGTVYYMDRLDFKHLDFGIYRCEVQCDHPEFRNIFTFSKNGFYTHLELQFAYKWRVKYGITIKLDVDCDDNCLLYTESDLVDSKVIFGTWFTRLANAKRMYKKNKVIKHLMSSLWGYLIKFDRIMCDDENDFINLDMSMLNDQESTKFKLLNIKCFPNDSENGHRTRYEYIDANHPYKNNLARLKPFFTSYARNYMVNLLISENLISKYIRSHTDSIVLTVPHDFTHLEYYPIAEDKTTGLITWSNVNKYLKV